MSSFLASGDLLVCAATLSGAPPLSSSRWSLEDRVVAANAAGFTAIGVACQEYVAWREEGVPSRTMAATAAEHNVRIAELEFLHGWASDDPAMRRQAGEKEDVLWGMADLFGARHVNVGDLGVGPEPLDFGHLVERFARLCDRAARHGLLVGYEWFAGTILPSPAMALRLVEAADRSNAGLVVDVVHLIRAYGRGAGQVIRGLPPDRVVAVQLADGNHTQIGIYADRPDPRASAGPPAHPLPLSRLPPGDGAFDLVSVLLALADIGVEAPIGVEIISPEMAALTPTDAAQAAFRSTSLVLDRAREAYQS